MSARATRRLAIALAISVGINLFIGGMVTSAWLARSRFEHRQPHAGAMMRPLDLRRGMAALGEADRPSIREMRERFGPELRRQGREMHEAQREVGRLLRADTLDRAELERALETLRRTSDATQQTMHRLMVGIVGELSPEQRRRFFDAAIRKREGRREFGDAPPELRRERGDRPPGPPPIRQ